MQHSIPLITTIVVGIVLAFVMGTVAQRLRVSPLVGYLLAGVLVGPFTPGFVADVGLAHELAEIGVILLMFGVGLHFSVKDLLSVKAIAIPGAIVQIAAATLLGMALTWSLGWPPVSGFVFGLALSTASTVVLLRALQERRLVDTERGRIAVGWLIVEDLAMVLSLVLLPGIADLTNATSGAGGFSSDHILQTIGLTMGKVAAFVALMLLVGRKVIPAILHYVAYTGSRELFRLAVLAIALGVAFAASELFGVSFALGAFFAGMMLSESELSQQAAAETLPLRDAFAVLFFVSVGMLFDPSILIREPWPLIATILIIIFGKSIAAFFIVRAFGYPTVTAATISASLAQIGEFSFILAGLGVALTLLPERGRDLILAGSIISILANPFCFVMLDRLSARLERRPPDEAQTPRPPAVAELRTTDKSDHTVLIGYGRVGRLVGEGLKRDGRPFLVIEDRQECVEELRDQGVEALLGNAAAADLLAAANVAGARSLVVAIPNAFEAGQITQQARAANPEIEIVARAHSDAEVEHLQRCGATVTIMGEREIAHRMLGFLIHPEDPATKEAAPVLAPFPLGETEIHSRADTLTAEKPAVDQG